MCVCERMCERVSVCVSKLGTKVGEGGGGRVSDRREVRLGNVQQLWYGRLGLSGEHEYGHIQQL